MVAVESSTSIPKEQNTYFFRGDTKGIHAAKRRALLSPPSLKERGDEQEEIEKRRSEKDRHTMSTGAAIMVLLILSGILLCLMEVFFAMSYLDNFMEYNVNTNTLSQRTLASIVENKGTPTHVAKEDNVEPNKEKQRVMQILSDAGIDGLDEETIHNLPTWSNITSLYGDRPRIYGLDQCQVFQNLSNPAEHFVAPAGTFNSGTNLMSELLRLNCHMPARMRRYGSKANGMRFQVPWGKHSPPSDEEFRQTHKTTHDKGYDANFVLPVVTIRDPYTWMVSMCRKGYTARWRHTDQHCPILVPNDDDMAVFKGLKDKQSVPVVVRYNGFLKHHDSLAHMYNEWYGEYMSAEFPRIIVRLEDLVFHPKETTETICKCAGGELNQHDFQYVIESAKASLKGHGKNSTRTTFIDAIMRYGTGTTRYQGFTMDDLLFAKDTLNRELVEYFKYADPPASLLTN